MAHAQVLALLALALVLVLVPPSIAAPHASAAAAAPYDSADVSLPYPPHIARGPARPLLYKTLGVDANQTLRQAANGVILMGTAIGEGYVTDALPSKDEPICQRKCAQAGGCPDGSSGNAHALCGCAPDGASVVLNCSSGGTITAVTFASVGTPTGSSCGNFSDGKCAGDPGAAKAYVTKQCVGKSSCALSADINTFNSGKDPCYGVAKHVAVAVTCSTLQPPPPPPPPSEQAPSGMNPYPSNAQPAWKEGIHTAAKYRAVAAREYDMTSPENACKFDATEPAAGEYNWAGCDLLANFTNIGMGNARCDFEKQSALQMQQSRSKTRRFAKTGSGQAQKRKLTPVFSHFLLVTLAPRLCGASPSQAGSLTVRKTSFLRYCTVLRFRRFLRRFAKTGSGQT
jgi:hypothetical protein